MPHTEDQCYRKLFGHRDMVRALFDGILPVAWARELDLSVIRPLPTQLVSTRARDRRADLAWRIRRRDGGDSVMLLMLEHQSRVDHYMSLRMMSYCALLYEDMLAQRTGKAGGQAAISRKKGSDPLPAVRPRLHPLPAVLPIVLYTGQSRWRAPSRMAELLEAAPAELRPYQPQMAYLVLDTGALVADEALPPDNLAALLFQLEHNQGIEYAAHLLQTLEQRLRGPAHTELSRAVAMYVRHVLLPRALPGTVLPPAPFGTSGNLTEITAMTTTLSHSRDWTLRFRLEGREEGMQAGQAQLLARLLTRRFGALSAATQSRLSGASRAQLETWSLNILDARTLDDVFRDQ